MFTLCLSNPAPLRQGPRGIQVGGVTLWSLHLQVLPHSLDVRPYFCSGEPASAKPSLGKHVSSSWASCPLWAWWPRSGDGAIWRNYVFALWPFIRRIHCGIYCSTLIGNRRDLSLYQKWILLPIDCLKSPWNCFHTYRRWQRQCCSWNTKECKLIQINMSDKRVRHVHFWFCQTEEVILQCVALRRTVKIRNT